MVSKDHFKGISIVGIIPQYPRHSQYSIYGGVRMPPVGIISVLSQINHDSRFKEVYAIDENNYRGPRDFMNAPDHDFLQKREPAKIAMLYGGMSNSIPRMFSIARQYKGFGAITIAGGSHVDPLPEEALSSGIDIVVHGEGEETAQEILEEIVQNGEVMLDRERLATVKGISFLNENGAHVFSGERKPVENLDRLNDPDLTTIKFLKKGWSAIPISWGRGCNWRCEFCAVSNLYGSYKASSTEKVLRQIVRHSDLGDKKFFVTDDNFTQNPAEAIELCKMIGDYKRASKKKIDITVQVRSEVAENDELIEAMRFAGVTTLAIGYESPINEELRRMRKGVTVEKLIERSRKLSGDFYLHGMFIFGYPEFKDSIHKSNLTLEQIAREYGEFFKKARVDTVQVFNAVPLPGTNLRTKLEAEKRILPLERVGWERYDGMFLCYDPRPEGLDSYDLQNLPKILMKKWYLGNFLGGVVNYGNWMNWTYNATIGFPVQFGFFYIKRFVHNLVEKRREKSIVEKESLLPRKNVFYASLKTSLGDITRRWRNLFIKTYGGQLARNWFREYERSGYTRVIEGLRYRKPNKN